MAPPIMWEAKTMHRKKMFIALAYALFSFAAITKAYDYDANDFAIEVIDYVEGSGVGLHNDPNSAVGRPSLETGGKRYPETEPVVPVFQPWLANQVITIGDGGRLTVKFSHPLENDRNNPYGVDFIVFGNSFLVIALVNGNEQDWDFGNPEQTIVSGAVASEPGIVSVSQDGQTWYTFSDGPYADDFAPTAAYRWDDVNDVWGTELDPTRPLDPNLSAAEMDGMTVAEVIELYNGSAGGTGFDIGVFGFAWIQYVRIEDDPRSDVTTEIDAISDVTCCGDYRHPFPVGDLNKDCRVDMLDFGLIAAHWLDCTWDCP